MKKILKSLEPSTLTTYRTSNPNNDWEQFRRNTSRKRDIQTQLKLDQGGLCAYCEIDLIAKDETGGADFRVEHFHPKSDNSTNHNWHLDWSNLLGCCAGGNQKGVADAGNRFTSPDYSCDVPKDNKNLDDVILNPLRIPAYPCLFKFERSTGKMLVNQEACQNAEVDMSKAQATIDELHLNANRLITLRKATLDQINIQLRARIEGGRSMDDAVTDLAKVLLSKNASNHWPRFFSSIRNYLGSAAEEYLSNSNYSG